MSRLPNDDRAGLRRELLAALCVSFGDFVLGPGRRVAIVDAVATTGGSLVEAGAAR